MKNSPFPRPLFGLFFLAISLVPMAAQEQPEFRVLGASEGARAVQAQARPAADLAHADLRPVSRMSGHLPGWVNAANDVGAVADGTMLPLDFVLARPAEAQAAFDKLLLDQQTPGSPRFHGWLTPQQIGLLYGPKQADLDVLTGWLTQQGFHVDEVAPSRTMVRASAPAGTVARALSTSFRQYRLPGAPTGKVRMSAAEEPAIPTALKPLVAGIAGLSEIPDEPQHRVEVVHEAAGAGSSPGGTQPNYTSSSTGNHYIAPGDFSVIYDVPTTVDGTGQRVAIIGRSQVSSADITNFLISVGMPSKLPNVVIPPLGLDPGLAGGGDQGEATLDVQRVMGSAPGAQADLVISSSAGGGLRTAIQYNVQTLLDPVMTISFGACEANAGAANVNLYTQLFSQAAAEGISVFVSSGDSGAAGCDTHSVAPPTTTQFASINYICSSGFATCVGGTEFAEGANAASYWSTTNSGTRTSALSYIPEGVWNDPSFVSGGVTNFVIASGGGGVSTYTPKPQFQVGNGVPADGFRDTPDVSLSGSGHDGYFGCLDNGAGGGDCVRNAVTGLFSYVSFSGTSAAAPGMAAITALLNQKLGSAQGNLNPLLYRLAATASNGVFHDTTVATSGVTGCTAAVPTICNNSTPSATALTGGLAGYVLTPGFDLATGWGSPDVGKLLTIGVGAGTPTTTVLSGSSGSIPPGQSLSFTATVALNGTGAVPTGTVQFYANGTALGGPITVATAGSSAKASLSIANTLPLGTAQVTATYSGDSNAAYSVSNTLVLIVVPGLQASTTVLTATPNPTLANVITILATPVTATSGAGPVPGGTVSLYSVSNGTANLAASTTLSGGTASFRFTFGAGAFHYYATYSGDGNYAASISPAITINSTAGASTTVLTGPTSLPTGSTLTVSAAISNLAIFAASDSVAFLDGTTLLGTVPASKVLGTTTENATLTTGILANGLHSITAVYSGNQNSLGSTSAPLLVQVGVPPGITITPATSSISLSAGSTTGNTDVLTLGSVGSLSGTVTLACAVTYNGTATLNYPPTCGFSSTSVTLASGGTATSTLSIITTFPHATSPSGPRAGNERPGMRGRTGLTTLALAMLVLPVAWRRRRTWNALGMCVAGLACMGLLGLSGCGGSSGGGGSPPVLIGTTAGSYSVAVTATGTSGGSNVTSTATVGLTVQ